MAPVLAWTALDGRCVPLQRKKQVLKMSQALETRALTARRKVAVLVALAAERRLEKAGHTTTLSAERRSVAARAIGEMVMGFFIWQRRQGCR